MEIDKILAKIFGTKHEREVKAMRPMVAAINELEPQMRGADRRGTGRADRAASASSSRRAPRSTIC